ncbi:MAG: hypothetical protein DRN14_00230 [Thermoplasmata archaeon]|nr:MAG: hypothetical protein DRN14_00230 [Thermoplasmata archaeon]
MFEPIDNQRYADIAGQSFDQEEVIPGPIIYGRTHVIAEKLHLIRSLGSCILLTSFSDASLTHEMMRQCPPNVVHWFSNNAMVDDQRVTNLPIGFRFSRDSQELCLALIREGRRERKNLMYVNFMRQIPRIPNPREGLYEQFAGLEWTTAKGGFAENYVEIGEFYQDIQSHDYVLSPPGAGIDCHRHWESIALGSIPVVLRSPVTDILDDMPCLRVNDWSEVTRERLEAELPELQKRFEWESMQKLDMRYWRRRIEDEIAGLRDPS